ncbi:thiamine phosphate synthase [Terrarubrum flagellatum]|uniref:thiamine phosphate synthase n=1 Tax=Terrirubrum flagellatum TaxID=2895980 RepID=UPI0031451417
MPKPQIYLITPVIDDAAAFAPILRAAVERTRAASVLLRLGATDERGAINQLKILAPVAQKLDAAVLIESDATVAARGGADGVHLVASAVELKAAVEKLQPDRIVGCGGLDTRHAAMEAGEAGVDYVMFGEPRRGKRGEEIVPDPAAVAEQAEWWARLFETPCVAYAASAEAVPALERTNAEFVGYGPWAFV